MRFIKVMSAQIPVFLMIETLQHLLELRRVQIDVIVQMTEPPEKMKRYSYVV